MKIGMLWYDDDKKRPLAEKVQLAADFYAAKYGRRPTDCHVHPSLLSDGGEQAAGLRLHPNRTIIVNYFWLGVDDPDPRRTTEAVNEPGQGSSPLSGSAASAAAGRGS